MSDFFSPAFIDHAIGLVGDEAAKLAIRSTLSKIGSLLSSLSEARESSTSWSRDPETLRLERERTDRIFSAVAAEMADEISVGRFDTKLADRESSEPSTQEFIRDALAAGLVTTLESKQMLLGRLIALRLQITTDSAEAITLRRAESILGDVSEHQLILLAAYHLVRSRIHEAPPVESRDEAESFFAGSYANVATTILERPPWHSSDFESLASLGVIRLDDAPGQKVQNIQGPDAIDDWSNARGLDPFDGIEGEVGTQDSHQRFRARFPIITALKSIAGNRINSIPSAITNGWRVDGIHVAPVGDLLGRIVLDQLIVIDYRVTQS